MSELAPPAAHARTHTTTGGGSSSSASFLEEFLIPLLHKKQSSQQPDTQSQSYRAAETMPGTTALQAAKRARARDDADEGTAFYQVSETAEHITIRKTHRGATWHAPHASAGNARGAVKIILAEWITKRIAKVSGPNSIRAAIKLLKDGDYKVYGYDATPLPMSYLADEKTEVGDVFVVHSSVSNFAELVKGRGGMLDTWRGLEKCQDA